MPWHDSVPFTIHRHHCRSLKARLRLLAFPLFTTRSRPTRRADGAATLKSLVNLMKNSDGYGTTLGVRQLSGYVGVGITISSVSHMLSFLVFACIAFSACTRVHTRWTNGDERLRAGIFRILFDLDWSLTPDLALCYFIVRFSRTAYLPHPSHRVRRTQEPES